MTAAGLLPVRIRATGSRGTELSDAYMSSISCSFCRHCINLALRGSMTFLMGLFGSAVATTSAALTIYGSASSRPLSPLSFSLPRKVGEEQVEWYRDELANYRQSLGRHFDVEITDERLREAIKLHNKRGASRGSSMTSEKGKKPAITGAEALAVIVAGTAMPKERYNQLLRELLDEISMLDGIADYRARLMIMDSILDDPAYVKVIEDLGGLVVADSLCFGTRILWKDVDEQADPLTALARNHIQSVPPVRGCTGASR